MLPLLLSLFAESNFAERFERTIIENRETVEQFQEEPSLDALINALPDHRIAGAHLARDTFLHWVYAGISLTVFVGLYMSLFRNVESGKSLMVTSALFTATVGIFMLLAFQWLASVTQGVMIRPRGIIGLLFLIAKLIGYSYSAALDPNSGFIPSLLGFTFGVGLCEEICKAIPVVYFLRESRKATWRSACLVGLASGVGFGVSEGITYSADMYNGLLGFDIYLVRFISCVALHSAWSGGAAVIMYYNQAYLPGEADGWGDLLLGIAIYLGIAIILHGLYDTLLKQEQSMIAMAIAIGSVGWFIWVVERVRDED